MNYSRSRAAVCAFKNEFIYAFYGTNSIQETVCIVEQYDISKNLWNVIKIDGHNMLEIIQALDNADEVNGKPTIIIARTVKGKGVSFAEHKASFHNGMLDKAQYEQACRELQN